MINPKSSIRLLFSKRFNADLAKVPASVKIALDEALELFEENPLNPHPSLRSHSLKERYSGHLSIDVTGDWRVVYKIHKRKTYIVITFRAFGTHEELYGKI